MRKNRHSEEPAARKPSIHQIKHVGWKQQLASMQVLFPVCLSLCFSSAFRFSLAADAIVPGQSISGQQTLISAGGIFVLGFFSPGNPKNRYLGIWFNKGDPPAVIWVANRENPITDFSPGLVQFNNNGNLVVSDGNQNSSTTLWSTNSSISASSAILLDYGNLVLMDESGRLLWQSFDYPTDTYIPGIKIGTNLETGFNWFLSSWKSPGDPSPGNFTVELDLRGLPQLVIMKGRTRYWSGGPWDGGWSGVPEMDRDYIGNYSFVRNEDEVYYWNLINNSTILFRVVLEPTGVYQVLTWSDANGVWIPAWLAPKGPCQFYGTCGAFGVCNVDNFQRCTCLDGFEPRSQQDWDLNDWSGGCVRKTGLMCGDGDGFFRLVGMKFPDTSFVEVDEGLGVEECRVKCLGNCSCTAYANFGASGNGSGCAIWNGDLIDVQKFSNGGEEFYLRVASSELGPGTTNKTISLETKKRKTLVIAVAIPLSGMLLLVAGCSYLIWKKMNLEVLAFNFSPSISSFIGGEDGKKSPEYRRFKFGIIEAATNNFSHTNKLGEGGFGPVYKGKLPNGQEIAVKRLSKSSGQGISEFHTEVVLTAKLQHRNLVRLLGYGTQGEEKILIYEYMPNKGLDSFLFDQDKSTLLDWKKRLNIITGIARGMLYLHEDSRLRVIHRDLKSSNILLDAEMSPKISDFGMARSFGRNQTQANTRKVVGTYGYMSPEYAVRGVFSEKSDIFSFGILILEIVSGKKINDFCHSDDYLSLTGYGWKLWNEGRGLEFMDPSLSDSCHTWEVIRCIHIGLLCVQESPRDRPNISFIVSMLGSEIDLPLPKKPAFSTVTEIDPTSTHLKSYSTNNVTITAIQGR